MDTTGDAPNPDSSAAAAPAVSAVSAVDVRRALLGQLLEAGGPVPIEVLVGHLAAAFGHDVASPKRASDILRYQMRLGRVRRVARGTYEAEPRAMSRSMIWRCINWRRERVRQDQRRMHDLRARPSRTSTPERDAGPVVGVRSG